MRDDSKSLRESVLSCFTLFQRCFTLPGRSSRDWSALASTRVFWQGRLGASRRSSFMVFASLCKDLKSDVDMQGEEDVIIEIIV